MDGDHDDDASSWSSVYSHHDGDHDDDTSSWSSVYTHHASRYPYQVRFMMRNEQGVAVMGLLQRIPNTLHICWVR